MKNCNQCHTPLELTVGILTTNISFPILTFEKLYRNDDMLLKVCMNSACPNFALVQIALEDIPNKKQNKKQKGEK